MFYPTHLIFGCNFNQKIILSNKITHLTFGYMFNKQIILSNSITHLTFGNKYYLDGVKKCLSKIQLFLHEKFINSIIIPNHIKVIYH